MNQMNFARIIRYLITGAVTVVTLIGVLYLLRDVLQIWYLLASTIAFLITLCVSFTLQKFWVFESQGLLEIKQQMGKYILLSLCNLAANTALMYVLVDRLQLNHLFAQAVVAGILACWGFFLYAKVIFK